MKVKRLVSVLLAALLLVGMIPMNAFAALTSAAPKAEVKLMISTTAPDKSVVLPAIPDMSGGVPSDIEDKIDAAVTAANDAWKWEDSGEASLEPGDTVYVGVKITSKDSDYDALYAGRIMLVYDSTVLEAPAENQFGSETAAKNRFRGQVVLNKANLEVFSNSFYQNEGVIDDLFTANAAAGGTLVDKYKPAQVQVNANMTSHEAAAGMTDKNLLSVAIEGKSSSVYAASNVSTWDFVIPLKVKAAPTETTATIEMVENVSAGLSEITLTKDKADGYQELNGNLLTLNKNVGNGIRTTSNDVTINVVKKSDPPAATEANYTDSITNNANKPYLTATDASATANGGFGPNDYITFPTEETGFAIGDKIYVYGDENGNKLLGVTTLKSENFYKGAGEMYGAGELTGTVEGKTLRLASEAEDGTAKDGYGYIKNHSKVWIGRLSPNTENPDGLTIAVDKTKLIGIDVTPETSLNYNGNIAAVAGETESDPLGSKGNPSLFGCIPAPRRCHSHGKSPAAHLSFSRHKAPACRCCIYCAGTWR